MVIICVAVEASCQLLAGAKILSHERLNRAELAPSRNGCSAGGGAARGSTKGPAIVGQTLLKRQRHRTTGNSQPGRWRKFCGSAAPLLVARSMFPQRRSGAHLVSLTDCASVCRSHSLWGSNACVTSARLAKNFNSYKIGADLFCSQFARITKVETHMTLLIV
jgi:hypothetical protein